MYFAREYANAILTQMYDIGLGAAAAAIENNANLVNGDGTWAFDYAALNAQLAKFGDASTNLVTLAMRGMQYHALIGDASTAKAVENVMGATIVGGDAAAFGRDALVFDASSLYVAGSPATAKVLALAADAISLNESESRETFLDKDGTSENISYLFKFEGGFDVSVKGFSYSKTAGNTKAEILTPANWTQVAGDKQTAGTLGKYTA